MLMSWPQRSPLISSGMTRLGAGQLDAAQHAATEPAHFERDDQGALAQESAAETPQRSPLISSGMTSLGRSAATTGSTCRNGARSFRAG